MVEGVKIIHEAPPYYVLIWTRHLYDLDLRCCGRVGPRLPVHGGGGATGGLVHDGKLLASRGWESVQAPSNGGIR